MLGDKSGLIKSAVDYRNVVEGEEKGNVKVERMPAIIPSIIEVFMDKLLAANYFSLLRIAVGELDPRVCHMTDPAYCVLGNRILVCSSHFDYHMGHLRNLFFLFRDWGVKVAPEECFFAKRSVNFLGHIFFENTVAPDQEFLNLIDQLPYPEKYEDAHLIGLCLTHFKHFLEDFNESIRAIKEYTKRTASPNEQRARGKFRWSVIMQNVVDRVKKELRSTTPLVMPDLREPLIIETRVYTDSGGVNILQKGTDGGSRPIERMSRLFGSDMTRDKNEQEIALLHWALVKPRVARLLKLSKQPCIVYTRQSAMEWLLNTDHAKDKFEPAKTLISSLRNLVFRDRSAFFQDFPAVHASPDIIPETTPRIRKKSNVVPMTHSERREILGAERGRTRIGKESSRFTHAARLTDWQRGRVRTKKGKEPMGTVRYPTFCVFPPKSKHEPYHEIFILFIFEFINETI